MLPRSPSPEPYVPSSEIGQLDLMSEHSTSFKNELKNLDKDIMRRDRIRSQAASHHQSSSSDTLIGSDRIGELYSPLKGLKAAPKLITRRQRAMDLKIEGPLTPPMSTEQPLWKKKDGFKNVVTDLLPDLPPPMPKPPGECSSDDIDRFFDEVVRPQAAKFERHIEQEQLVEADTTRRVKVPVMDFQKPPAPWKQWAQSSTSVDREKLSRTFLENIFASHLEGLNWHIPKHLEQGLRWAPFPRDLAHVAVQEDIVEVPIDEWVYQPEAPDHSLFLPNIGGLTFLDDTEFEDGGLKPGEFPESVDFASMLRKRKLDLDEGDNVATYGSENRQRHDISAHALQVMNFPGDAFSASHNLGEVMKLRSARSKRHKATESTTKFIPANASNEKEDDTDRGTSRTDEYQSVERIAMPTPILPVSAPPSPFVFSSTIIRQRKLVREIRSLYPSATLIERDFTSHSNDTTTVGLEPMESLLQEADLILSPSTGLISTSLQRLHQHPPPGQRLSKLQHRILHTAPRYSTLLILISQNNSASAPLSTADCAAFCDLLAFSQSTTFSEHDITVQPIIVPGGEDELARWVVSLMVKHGVQDGSVIKLLQDETTWEIWLRRAGMNAFGAQAILAALKAPRQHGEASMGDIEMNDVEFVDLRRDGRQYGLPAFVRMTVKERLKRFSGLFGGEGLLNRVSAVINMRW